MNRIFRPLLTLLLFVASPGAWAQSATWQELSDTKPRDPEAEWQRMRQPSLMSWGSTDTRYAKWLIPRLADRGERVLRAWRGERVAAQAVVWTRVPLRGATLALTTLTSGRDALPAGAATARFVRYVMTDELNHTGKGNCGHRPDKTQWDSSLVADPIDTRPVLDIEDRTARPVWVSVQVPPTARPGSYRATLTLAAPGMKPLSLPLRVDVQDRLLPAPEKWQFHLDLWQNPYAVAREAGVPLWSEAHFDAMRPVMRLLAQAGQKAITASIMGRPWNGQTEDAFASMIVRTRTVDGRWTYDYTVFDRWVDFMLHDVGIDGLISCYTMIPWALRFDYVDQTTATVRYVEARPGDAAYRDYWGNFLRDFARHLRAKGWFQRTAISMDERSMEDMRAAIQVIREADPEYKITLAGNYHPEIAGELHYLSVPFDRPLDYQLISDRRRAGQLSTYYVCCTETFPNTFTFSPPAESAWIPLHALAQGYDGVLRWAYNSWTADPLRDSRFRSWPAGDCYLVYPGGRSSIRFERLVEGIQCCEKARLLAAEMKARGDRRGAERIERALEPFSWRGLEATQASAAEMIRQLEEVLNGGK